MKKNLISIEGLQKTFPDKVICKDESFGIFAKDKIGLIGINGCGKTTLLKMIIGIEPVDSGKVVIRNNVKIGYLPQVPELDQELTIFEHIYFSDHPQFALLRQYHRNQEKLETLQDEQLESEQHKLLQRMDSEKTWDIEIKAKSILTKLGFSDLNLNIATLSGGQKRRLDLARVLMDEPEILILDEPTNHLDIDTIEWFQDFLINYKGALIFVTHDRYFLDAVSNRIMEIENGIIRFYNGNYSYYLRRKELELVDLQRKETRRAAQLQKEMKWLNRGARARSSKPKNHLDRVKELIDKSYLNQDSELDISFQSKRMGKTILEIKNVQKSYDQNHLFSNFNYNFQKLDRIGIIGPNGCGKTTLLRLITDEIEPDAGNVKAGMNTHFSYFRQNEEEFDKNISVLEYVRQRAEHIRTADGTLHSASEMLKKFLFDGKLQQSKVKSLSGGERKRLYLLSSLMFGSNFIILDEPTNDLDIKTLEILEDYLDVFKGCILVVSHDRYFLDRVVDYLFIFENDRIIKFPGNYSDYLLVKKYREEQKIENTNVDKKRIRSEKTGLSYKEKRELDQLEIELEKLENLKISLENKIDLQAATLLPNEFSEITKQIEELNNNISRLSDRWLVLEDKKSD